LELNLLINFNNELLMIAVGSERRTLDRRLNASGVNFQEALDETRCEYAQRLLECTQLKIANIDAIDGYADASRLMRGSVLRAGRRAAQNCAAHRPHKG
jgi:transcriptional regulator GlxA family with amidase domain